ncbi:unnamed protein product [Auanema sp. JU1783]|nr:unnamed protein product [Auanema sp. JU1783]
MAHIAQLKISGVRSVGVDEEDAHIIKFLNPLTIISGPNGTGKTTIIECLNYVTTGALPAGNLPTFIHNLRLSRRSRVDSMVKLQFYDSKNRECVATKRMTSSLTKGDKLKTESEEFTIQIRKDGVEKKISSKVADFRKEMLNLLGIPTAILESVVFCHQEDSCWPLSESKELKKRFDKIFQLTKFVKAVDQMKKIRKDYLNELKVLMEKKNNGEMLLLNKAKYMRDLKNTEKSCSDASEKLTELKTKIQDCTSFIKLASEKLVHFEKLQRTIDLKNAELRGKRDHLSNLNCPPFNGSVEMLQAEIDQITSLAEFQNLMKEKSNLEQKMSRIRKEVEDLKVFQKTKNDEMAKFKGEEMLRSSLLSTLGDLEQNLCSKYGLKAGVNFDTDFAELVKTEESVLGSVKFDVSEQRKQYDETISTADSSYNSLKFELSAVLNSLAKLGNEIRESEQRLQSAATSQSEINSLNVEIKKLENNISQLPISNDEKSKALRDQREYQQTILADIRLRLKKSELFEETEKDIERKSEEYNSVHSSLEEMKEKHRETFLSLFDRFDEGPWSKKITTAREATAAKQSTAEKSLNKALLNAEREKQNIVQIEKNQKLLKTELTEIQSNILNTSGCLPDDVTSQLNDVKTSLKQARKDLAPLDTKAILYESWSNEVQEKSCCPLCERKFSGKTGAQDLSKKLINMSISFPEEIERLQSQVSFYEEKENLLSSAAVDVDRIKKIEVELTELAARREESEKILVGELGSVRTCRSEVQMIKNRLTKLDLIQMDIGLMDNYLSSSSRIKLELEELKLRVPCSDEKKSCRELKMMIDDQEELINRLIHESEAQQAETNKRNHMCEKLNSLRDQRITLGEAAAQATMILEQMEIKKKDRLDLLNKEKSLKLELPIAAKNRESAKNGLVEFTERIALQERKQNQIVQVMLVEKSRLDDLVERLTKISENRKQSEECSDMLQKTENDILQKTMLMNRLENQAGDLDNMTARKRTLEEQKTRLILENHVAELVNEINDMELEAEDPDTIREELNRKNSQKSKAEVEQGRIEGQLAVTEKTRREAQQALGAKNMKEAEKIYRDVVVDQLVCEKTIEDLDKYSKCLDTSILRFHTEKMAAINDILDDLWRKVYKGGDIESIKIISDVAGASTDKRKSYEYKVVMLVEGGIEMDMRDRCSAGQKMLACILIRIALADVFGGVCSMIALDEPTTNLDVHKVEYLAEMLNDLISARRNDDEYSSTSGRQFQMIVITHDQRLVEQLTLGTRPDFYYVLEKDMRGLSNIRRKYPNGETEPSK